MLVTIVLTTIYKDFDIDKHEILKIKNRQKIRNTGDEDEDSYNR